jgi:phage terminase large subunit-like protein
MVKGGCVSPRTPKPDYVAMARAYADEVLSGRITANRWTKAACQRQRDDLARQDSDWPYRFDSDAAAGVCGFLSRLKHVKGEKGGQRFVIEPWESFILTTVFGWLHKETGLRRFRRSFIECGKGNGKSFLSSGIAAFMLAADGEPGAEVVCAARAQDQARTVFDLTREMLRADGEICAEYGYRVMQHTIEHPATASVMRPVSAQSKTLAGGSFHFASADETWAHRNRDVVDELERGIDKRRNSLLSTITHADSNLSSVGYEQHVTATQILGGELKDERTFCIIYSAEGFKWDSEDAWRAANPNLGVSVYLDTLGEACVRAQKNAALQSAFRAKNLCEWIGGDISFLDPIKLDKCRDAAPLEGFKYWREGEPGWEKDSKVHRPFVLGLDLASRMDLASCVWLCIGYVPDDKREHYYAWSKNYLPAESLESSPISQYKRWAAAKQIICHPGGTLDLEKIEADILSQYRRHLGYGAVNNENGFKIKAAAFDSWQASQMTSNLSNADILAVEFPKTAKMYSPVMDFFSALVLEGRFHMMLRDDVLLWALTNVHCHRDRNENLFPNKIDPNRKIDPAVALFYALKAAMSEGGKFVKPDTVMDCPIKVLDVTPPKVRYGENAW